MPSKRVNKRLNQYLQQCRIKSKLTQLDVGKALGHTPQYICNFENGHCVPADDVVAFYINHCGAELAEVTDLILKNVVERLRPLLATKSRPAQRKRRS